MKAKVLKKEADLTFIWTKDCDVYIREKLADWPYKITQPEQLDPAPNNPSYEDGLTEVEDHIEQQASGERI